MLAGTIAGLLAQGLSAYDAAVAGAFLHALAAQVVTTQIGEIGMVAGDLLNALPLAMRALRQPQVEESGQ